MDDDISNVISQTFSKGLIRLDTVHRVISSEVALTGSLKEGGLLAKLFLNNPDFHDNINRIIDFDTETIIYELPVHLKHCVENLTSRELFAQLQIMNGSCKCKECFGTRYSNRFQQDKLERYASPSGYMKPYRVKFRKHFQSDTRKLVLTVTRLAVAYALNIPLSRVFVSSYFSNVTVSTVELSCTVCVDRKPTAKLNIDITLIIKLNWCSSILSKWKQRKRNWPFLKDIQIETSESYLITKPSFREKSNKDSIELRYSFTHLERKLVSLQSSAQRIIYLIFKSMIYKWLKPVNPDKITSYIGKNVMLWACEQFPPSHQFWEVTTASILKTLKYFFKRLYFAFHKGFLPYYFIPSVNVIDNVPSVLVKQLITITASITKNVKCYLPRNTGDVITLIHKVRKWIFVTKDGLDEVIDDLDMSFIFERRPEFTFLLPKYLGKKLSFGRNS